MNHYKLYYTAANIQWTLEKNFCGYNIGEVLTHFHENYPWAQLLDWRQLTLPEYENESRRTLYGTSRT